MQKDKLYKRVKSNSDRKFHKFSCARSAVSETTATSTYATNMQKEHSILKNDTSEELYEDLFVDRHDSKNTTREEYVGEGGFN